MSPPLVVAFALAGRVDIDMDKEPIGKGKDGKPVFLKELWPTEAEIEKEISQNLEPSMFKQRYANILEDNPLWKEIGGSSGRQFDWDEKSTYIQKPPYFEHFTLEMPARKELKNMRCLALLGDSVTTDHISPAGSFKPTSPAGKFLLSKGVQEEEFNSYGSRRGNHYVMMRGTFANVRIKNKMADGKEGGFTRLMPDGPILPIFEACEEYAKRKTPLILFAGNDYGMGSSRDWAAKGTNLLGVRAVVAQSFERIHRSNLIGMGVLPLEFIQGMNHESLGLTGSELFSLCGIEGQLRPGQEIVLEIARSGKVEKVPLKARLDTQIEIEYYLHGGIMPYVLRQILKNVRPKK
jgi:aconitate hydratase